MEKSVIEYRKVVEKYRIFNPTINTYEDLEIEIRFDPLTGKPCRILPKPLPISRNPDISADVEVKPCPFCDEMIDKVVARDVEVLGEKLLKKGEAVLFANLTPYAKYSLVVRLTSTHYVPLGNFKSEWFFNAFSLIQEYLKMLESKTKEYKFVTIIMNYLKSAGSSIVHPHLQVIISGVLMDYQERIVKAAKEFYDKYNVNYWIKLMELEEKSERFIHKNTFFWYAPFAPRGFEHVSAITLKPFTKLNNEELTQLADGIVRVFKAYHDAGYNAINMSIFSPTEEINYMATLVDIVTRSNLDRYYWCDVFAITKLFDEAYTIKKPEEVASHVRKYFIKT